MAAIRVMAPPNTTEGTIPINRAEKPDSNSPSSLVHPKNIEFIEETLPPIFEGVIRDIIVLRITPPILSKAPIENKNNKVQL